MGFDVKGLAELRAKLTAMKERANDPGPGLMRAGMVVVRATKDHIKSGSGDQGPWPPNQTGTPLLFRTGRLANSLTVNVSGDTAQIGTNLFYAAWVQGGTGIFGPTGMRIFPKTAKALAWEGHVVRSTAGMPARRFLFIDEQQANLIRSVLSSYIVNGLPSNVDQQ